MGDRTALVDHYRAMSDEQFTHFATHEAAGLTPLALEVVREELARRGTVPDPEAAIDVQLRPLSDDEFEVLVTRFRELPCPSCSGAETPLSAAELTRGGRREVIVGCVTCLTQQLEGATGTNTPTFWLSAVYAPGRGATARTQNREAIEALGDGARSPILREYLWAHRGAWAHLLK